VCGAGASAATRPEEISSTGDAARDLATNLRTRFEDAALRAAGVLD